MATLSSELALAKRCHTMSQVYDTRPNLARRSNTLSTLKRFMGSMNRELRKLALDAVHLLAEHPDNVDLLGGDTALIHIIFGIYKDAQYDDPELYELSSLTMDALSEGFVEEDPRKAEVLRRASEGGRPSTRDPSHSSVHSTMDVSGDLTTKTSRLPEEYETVSDADRRSVISTGTGISANQRSTFSASRRPATAQHASTSANHTSSAAPSVVHGVGRSGPHSVTLELPSLSPFTDTTDLEDVLQSAKGLISYTIASMDHQVRVFLTPEALVPLQRALSNAGFPSTILSYERMDLNQSFAGGAGEGHSYYDEEAKANRPSYVQSVKSFASSLCSAVMVYSGGENTLSARVQRQKARDSDRNLSAERLAKKFSNWW